MSEHEMVDLGAYRRSRAIVALQEGESVAFGTFPEQREFCASINGERTVNAWRKIGDKQAVMTKDGCGNPCESIIITHFGWNVPVVAA